MKKTSSLFIRIEGNLIVNDDETGGGDDLDVAEVDEEDGDLVAVGRTGLVALTKLHRVMPVVDVLFNATKTEKSISG